MSGEERRRRGAVPDASGEPSDSVYLSELLSSLSYALDLTEGQPIGHSVRGCLIGMRIGRELKLDNRSLSDLW